MVKCEQNYKIPEKQRSREKVGIVYPFSWKKSFRENDEYFIGLCISFL